MEDAKRTEKELWEKPELMAHLVAGYPNEEGSLAIARGLTQGGAAMLELQFPSSDPAADGPVIQEACRISLAGGFRMDRGFALAKQISESCPVPLYIMAYGSQIYARGIDRFVKDALTAGAQGIIAPDLTPGRDEGLYELCLKAGIRSIPVVPAGTDSERIRQILSWTVNSWSESSWSKPLQSAQTSGTTPEYVGGGTAEGTPGAAPETPGGAKTPAWVYCALRRGITGSKTELDQAALSLLAQVRSTGRPVIAGFGISEPGQVGALQGKSEAIVAGSCFVRAAEEALKAGSNPAAAVEARVRYLLSPVSS